MKKKFGENLRRIRKELGLTQMDLAKALNIGLSTVNNWEWGYSTPHFETLVKLKQILKCTYEELIDGE